MHVRASVSVIHSKRAEAVCGIGFIGLNLPLLRDAWRSAAALLDSMETAGSDVPFVHPLQAIAPAILSHM